MLMEQEFTAVAEIYLNTIYHVALSCTPSAADAEDAVQETMLRLWQTNTEFSSHDHIRYWLIRVCINVCRDLTRSFWHRRTVPLDACAELRFPDPEQQSLWDDLMTLPPKYKLPLYLYYYQGYSTEEISKMLGLTASAVRSRLTRARAKLKLQLEEEPV